MEQKEELREAFKEEKFDLKRELFEWVETIVVSMIIVSLISVYGFRLMNVVGNSMVPTLYNGEKVVMNTFDKNYEPGDVIGVKRRGDTPLVKRIIAKEYDKVMIDFEEGKVYVNDHLLDEPYINDLTLTRQEQDYPLIVPKGELFVMGDNRNHSDDSRIKSIGTVDERNVIGKVIFVAFPFDKAGKVN